ncbi:MAG TPA: glycosyltransferase family 2 protein [Jiangellaceae bacterium]|nr:glycosyltransferase family 2 protein [Jiangellaceae bacterium]
MSDERPGVSVVMPVRNEERHLREAVSHVLAQEYDGPIEVLVAVAPSTDRTAVIAEQLGRTDARVRLVPNPAGRTSAGLNAALRQARYDVIVRVDGHGVLSPGYIDTAVQVLDETGAANVGGVMHAEGDTPFEQAVAHAYRSRVGLGGGRYHVGGEPGPADSVYLGVFRRSALTRLGGFDEHFARAQDWELNYRLARAGETVWFTPLLRVSYRPRNSWFALAEQFFRTGQWRREVVRHYPDTANVRYLAPPVVVMMCAAGIAAGVAGSVSARSWGRLGFAIPLAYGAGVVVAGLVNGRTLPAAARMRLPGVLATMHLSWGSGFLVGVRSAELGRRKPRRARA